MSRRGLLYVWSIAPVARMKKIIVNLFWVAVAAAGAWAYAVLAAQFGHLPGTSWILIGVVALRVES